MLGIGLREIETRVLELNRYLTKRLAEEGVKVIAARCESHRSAETLVSSDEPNRAVSSLAAKKSSSQRNHSLSCDDFSMMKKI
jgi:hypothetical protein